MRYLSDSYATLYLGPDGTVTTRQTQAAKPQDQGFWRGDGVSGAPSIAIDIGRQEAFFYKSGQLVGMSPISTGREGYRTPTGNFSIIQKEKDHLSTLYGDYVDSSGNVVVGNVGVEEDPETSGNVFSRGANAVFHEDLRWSGNARRISPRGAGLARVHPLAPPYG